MNSIDRLLRPSLRGRRPYGAPQLDVSVRLNTNENSYPLPQPVADAVVRAVAEAVPHLNRYPDRDAVELRTELADYLGHDLTIDQVWAANGSNEILQQLLQAFGGPGRVALGFTPSYSMHPILAAATGTDWRDGGRDEDFTVTAEHVVAQIERHKPDVVFLCSPNNPTGTALDPAVVTAAVEHGDALVVVDEAYAEFARAGTVGALELLPGRLRLVVTRTMSKAFGLAGARLGYLAADPQVVDAVQLVRLPYHLSTLTQVTAVAALRHRKALLANVTVIRHERDRLVRELSDLGLLVAPSDANFVLFGGLADSAAVWQSLVDRGVLIRDVGIDGWLRVTAGTPGENDAFLSALATVLKSA
ncbi:histidinol-phosphate aminotransferase [Stackebrandtia endophytica]|uniref:Histidinol-phosphate aminotransferase n=1 Tax=Stackebrandtia endophytica TaxID=1496996 RepID=A0A543B386_9ACTN|nr:histidinol-phosphate transaminase [Stackebrandtia endophytica]TQL79299.1 histidinol-phosphate aminotransferase [Stackebrandtia endophytica]